MFDGVGIGDCGVGGVAASLSVLGDSSDWFLLILDMVMMVARVQARSIYVIAGVVVTSGSCRVSRSSKHPHIYLGIIISLLAQ